MSSSKRRYVIIGAGAVGGALAAELSRADFDVVLVARGDHGRRLRENGLIVRRPTGVDVIHPLVVFGPDEIRLTTQDVLFLTVKTQDVESALAEWAWQTVHGSGDNHGGLATDLPLVTFQNGIVAETLALRRFGRVYGATIAIAASYVVPGEIVSQSLPPVAGVIWIGRHPSGCDSLQDSVASDLNSAGLTAYSVSDSRTHKAAKLLGSVANVLDLMSGPDDLREKARVSLRVETASILRAAAMTLPPHGELDYRGAELEVLPVEGHVTGRFSTWQSNTRGTSSEVDFLNGEVVLIARQLSLEAPLNQRAQRLAASACSSGFLTLEALLDGID